MNQLVQPKDSTAVEWNTDEELFALVRAELTTCPISDVMELMGFAYPMLPHEIAPLGAPKVMIGRAMPVRDEAPIPHGGLKRYDSKPFGLLFESIEDLKPGEVYIASGGPTYAARLGRHADHPGPCAGCRRPRYQRQRARRAGHRRR